jgi:hypothetical protein
MARYYVEFLDDSIYRVVAQDANGLYYAGVVDGILRINRTQPYETWVKLPEWSQPRKVCTTNRDYLDVVRRVERNIRSRCVPGEIITKEGPAKEVIRVVIEDARMSG